MRRWHSKRKFLGILVIAMAFSLAIPVTTIGQGRGHGRGRGRSFDGFDRRFDKKCAKFVNCHDARDGRWDGRGPRQRFDDSRFFRRGRHRDRRFDDDRFFGNRRSRYRSRNFNDFSNTGLGGLGGLLDLFLNR